MEKRLAAALSTHAEYVACVEAAGCAVDVTITTRMFDDMKIIVTASTMSVHEGTHVLQAIVASKALSPVPSDSCR